MRTSTDRILFTHVGSLPLPPALKKPLLARQSGGAVELQALRSEVVRATKEAVERQIAAGVDVIGNGELSRPGFQTYIPSRMRGFGGTSQRRIPRDLVEFPTLAAPASEPSDNPPRRAIGVNPAAIGEVHYEGLRAAEEECEIFEEAAAAHEGRYVERFMTAPSPGIVATTMLNQYYDSHEAYVDALAREMAKEYRLIVERGFVLQIDAPDLAMERTIMYQDEPLATFLLAAEHSVAAINRAIKGLPPNQVRLHCCYGNYEGPHIHDIELHDILPILYQARVGALSLELANPRHQHEYEVLKRNPPPDHMILMPGVIDTTTNFVEHPQVVANRILQAVDAVGERERVIASTDCGFGTFASYELVHPAVVWPKLKAGAEGARIASERLWGRQ